MDRSPAGPFGGLLRLLAKAPRRADRKRRGGPSGAGPGRSARLDPFASRHRAALAHPVELQLYHDMRRSFPILDAAVTRLVQLCGHPQLAGPAPLVEELESWMHRVATGPAQRGLGSWVETHLDHLLVYGRAIGQVVVAPNRREILAVTHLDPREVTLEAGPDPLRLRVLHRPRGAFGTTEVPPALALVSLRAAGDMPQGASLLRSLPFVAEACSIIQNATAQVWQRVGAPSFHVSWVPGEGFSDPQGTLARGITAELEQSFSEMMAARQRGEVRDLFTSGEVRIAAIGSEGQILAVQEPFRVFMEQMVAVTGLPPWLLGLHWSSTERLSIQQADLLMAQIEALRREVQPQVERLLELRRQLASPEGRVSGRVRVVWPPVRLHDRVEQARGEALAELARARRIENARRMWELGFWSQERAAREADGTLAAPDRSLPLPPDRPPAPLPSDPASAGAPSDRSP